MMNINLATRGSKLALVQANMIKNALEDKGAAVNLIEVTTKGDRDQTSPINQIGGRGLFVTGIEKYLLDGSADIAAHSGKDLPYSLMNDLTIAGVPKAADSRDCLIARKGDCLKSNARIGTGSPRRIIECRKFYPNANYESIRGNVDTRLDKLRNGLYDAILLAKAGLDRLDADLSDFDVRIFEPDEFIPSACQGIMAVECRENDRDIVELLQSISDEKSAKRFEIERYMLGLMQADCSVALGAYSEIDGDKIQISALYNGKKAKRQGAFDDYKMICKEIKEELYG
ncbi:MAG: hydroxymethylbilane synthase [Clostridium sp.]|nr:hydroxymethylbilane synthase [Clostridium sp.]